MADLMLSVVVRVVGGPPFLRRLLEHLHPHFGFDLLEVVVPCDATIPGMAGIRCDYPWVTFLDTCDVRGPRRNGAGMKPGAAHTLYDRRTSVGLAHASGQVVAILEDHAIPAPDWCAQVLAAHEQVPYGVIGGAVEHSGTGALRWAIYFVDFGRYQLPLQEGVADYLTDVNVTYKRDVLAAARASWAERYNEATVHWALARAGVTLWLRPQIVVGLDRGPLTFWRAVSERMAWGRVFGHARAREISVAARLQYAVLTPAIWAVLLWRTAMKVFGTRRHRMAFGACLPLVVVMTACWCAGEFAAYITGSDGSPAGVKRGDTPAGAAQFAGGG